MIKKALKILRTKVRPNYIYGTTGEYQNKLLKELKVIKDALILGNKAIENYDKLSKNIKSFKGMHEDLDKFINEIETKEREVKDDL